MIKLVTGYKGEPHITSDDEAAKNIALFGDFLVFSAIGQQLGYTLVSNNQIRIGTGDLMVQGRHVRITGSEDVTIENGSQGMNRIDLICLRYTKDSSTGIENAELVVIKGEETSGTATRPEYTEGNILDGDTLVDFPLYEVRLSGLTVQVVNKLFTLYDGLGLSTSGTEIKETTMVASSWDSGTYSFESEYPFDECDIWIQVGSEATADQAKAFGAALIVGDANSNVYTALGEVPTVDIPIILRRVAK